MKLPEAFLTSCGIVLCMSFAITMLVIIVAWKHWIGYVTVGAFLVTLFTLVLKD